MSKKCEKTSKCWTLAEKRGKMSVRMHGEEDIKV